MPRAGVMPAAFRVPDSPAHLVTASPSDDGLDSASRRGLDSCRVQHQRGRPSDQSLAQNPSPHSPPRDISLQLTANYSVATPVNWKQGEDVIIVPSMSDEEAREKFPAGWRPVKPHLRITPAAGQGRGPGPRTGVRAGRMTETQFLQGG